MKQAFNLLKEYLKESINQWNKIQANHGTLIEMEVNEKNKYITIYDSKDPGRIGSMGYIFQGILAMGYSFSAIWNKTEKRIELLVF